MDKYDRIRVEIKEIEEQLSKLRTSIRDENLKESLKALSLRNDSIKSAFSNIEQIL